MINVCFSLYDFIFALCHAIVKEKFSTKRPSDRFWP